MKKTIKPFLITFFSLVVILVLLLIMARNSDILFPDINTKFSSDFSKDNYKEIHSEMKIKQVDSLIGKPLKFNEVHPNKLNKLSSNINYMGTYSWKKGEFFNFFEWHLYYIYYDKDSIVVNKGIEIIYH